MLDELGADDEVALHLRVDDQVHISLAVAQLGVGQAVKFLRQGQKGLGQQGHRLHPDGHLPPLGAEHDALHSHDVADIQLLEAVVLLPIHLVPAGIELDAARLVLQVAEGHLAHAPLGHEPPGQRDLAALHGVKIRLDGGAVVGDLIFGDLEGVTPPPWSSFSLSRRIWSSWDRFCSWFFSSAMLSLSYLCGWRGAQRCSTFSSLYSMRPAGASTTTWSPSLLPSRALPKGESSEMAPFMGSAS